MQVGVPLLGGLPRRCVLAESWHCGGHRTRTSDANETRLGRIFSHYEKLSIKKKE